LSVIGHIISIEDEPGDGKDEPRVAIDNLPPTIEEGKRKGDQSGRPFTGTA
jgi:hypothetical protein